MNHIIKTYHVIKLWSFCKIAFGKGFHCTMIPTLTHKIFQFLFPQSQCCFYVFIVPTRKHWLLIEFGYFYPTLHSRERGSTAQKMNFSIKDFFSKCDQIHRKLRILSHLLRKFLMKNFSFCAVRTLYKGRDIFHFRVFSTYLVKDYLQNEKISLWYLPLNFPCMWTRWGNKHPLW